jgi:pilus assembly protein CpaE
LSSSAILLLEVDASTADLIRATLEGAGHAVTVVEDADSAVKVAADHALLMVDLPGAGARNGLITRLREPAPPGRHLILAVAQGDDIEERIALIEAGADDVIVKPFDGTELSAKVEALLVRLRRRGDVPGGVGAGLGPAGRRVVVFFSPKGGAGTTTLAVNVALAMAEERPGRVALLDLDLQWGQASTHLDLRPRTTIAELTRDTQALEEPSLIKTYMEHKEPGLDILCAPLSPDNASLVTADHVTALTRGLRSTYDLVVVDAGSTLDERTYAAFETADVVVFTACPEIAALKALHSLLETLSESGAAVGKTIFVLNHVFGREMLKLQDIENSLAAKITLEVPHEPVLYLKAVNEGIPVVRGAPRSAPAERLRRLATLLAGTSAPAASQPTTEVVKPRGLGGLLKRG